MNTISWSRGILLPARVVAAVEALRRTVADLQTGGQDMGELRDALSRVREAFDRLERHAAQSELGFTDFARHLRFAERYVQEGKAPDASDMVAMGRRDLAALVREIEKVEVLPLDTAGLRVAQADLEGPTIELKAVIPSQVRDLAHEFAALAPDGGWVYLGVDDDGAVAGLDVATPKDVDNCDLRVRGIAGMVNPPIRMATSWLADDGRVVGALHVLASGEPIHYVQGVPYLRDGSACRPARPEEVKQRILQISGSRRPRLHIKRLELAQGGRGPWLKDLVVRAVLTNVGGGAALSVRALRCVRRWYQRHWRALPERTFTGSRHPVQSS